MSLKNKIFSGLRWTTLSAAGVSILKIIQIIILTRLLAPSDFGLMALVMVVVGFSGAFLDMGISNAIIHEKKISKDQLSTLYWVNIIAGFCLFSFIYLLSPYISSFYDEPRLVNLIRIVSLTFLITPFGQQFMVLWQKELRFNDIAIINISQQIVVLSVSVCLAIIGYGVYAIAYGVIAGSIFRTSLFCYKGFKVYPPEFVFCLKDTTSILKFGAFQMGERTLNFFNSQLDTILIGKFLGVESLGIYNVAKQIVMQPANFINPIVSNVAFPVMATIQENTSLLKDIYLKTIHYLSSINFPIYVFFIFTAPELVLLMFGREWIAAEPIMQILCLYAAIRSIGNPVGSLLLAKGKASWGFFWNLGLFFYVPVFIVVGSNRGLIGTVWSLVIVQMSLIIPNWLLLVKKLCNASFLEYHKQIFMPATLSAFLGLLLFYIKSPTGALGLYERFIIMFLGYGVLVTIIYYLFNKKLVQDLLSLIKR